MDYVQLSAIPEWDYLSRIIFRVYENKKIEEGQPGRFRIEIGVRWVRACVRLGGWAVGCK